MLPLFVANLLPNYIHTYLLTKATVRQRTDCFCCYSVFCRCLASS